MAHVIKLDNANNHYTHSSDNVRDYIFGFEGDDTIYGDNEEYLNYSLPFSPGNRLWSKYDLPPYDIVGVEFGPNGETTIDWNPRPTVDDVDRLGGDDEIAWLHPNVSGLAFAPFDEYIDGGSGNDTLIGRGGHDWIVGGWDNDLVDGGAGHDFLEGDAGDDTIYTGPGFDIVLGGTGNDRVLFQGAGAGDYADGGTDTDTLFLDPETASFTYDLVTGVGTDSSFSPAIYFDAINFEILDYTGGSGTDSVAGGSMNDTLRGGGGMDFLEGRDGNDSIQGEAGTDFLTGGAGSDTIHGGSEVDFIDDGQGDDTVYGDGGSDNIVTGAGNDTIYGGADGDVIRESDDGKDDPNQLRYVKKLDISVNDIIYGEAGGDKIDGGSGDDLIDGGTEGDTIRGGAGSDHMWGGADRDTFLFEFGDAAANGGATGSHDVIHDWQRDLDTLDLRGLASYARDGKLYFDNGNGTPGEAGEIMLSDLGGSTQLSIDFDGNGQADFSIDFAGLAFNPASISANNTLLV